MGVGPTPKPEAWGQGPFKFPLARVERLVEFMGNPRDTLEKPGLSYTGYKTENLPDDSVPRKP